MTLGDMQVGQHSASWEACCGCGSSYIRTGRADVFRMAEAMIWQTSLEVDTYHLGPYAAGGRGTM